MPTSAQLSSADDTQEPPGRVGNLRFTDHTVEVFRRGKRVAAHRPNSRYPNSRYHPSTHKIARDDSV